MFNWINHCVAKMTQVPYPLVPHDPESFLASQSRLKLVRKYLHRRLVLLFCGQVPLEIRRIEKGMRVLWLYTGKANFGDAIMEMSGRALLRGAGVSIDLLTLPKLHPLFCEDDIFNRVYASVDEVDPSQYDAIVLNEFNYPSIKLKMRHFKAMRFACLFGYFHGPARNQTLFSFAAVNDVFGVDLPDEALIRLAKPYLHQSPRVRAAIDGEQPAPPAIALSVGGIDENRSYRHWPDVLGRLDAMDDESIPRHIVLLGSENGVPAATEILQRRFQRLHIVSHVARSSLLEARAMIENCRLFVGCDGGLMHVAHSTGTPSVTLFASGEQKRFFLTERCHSLGLQSPGGASEISPGDVVQAVRRQLAASDRLREVDVQAASIGRAHVGDSHVGSR
jgi:heptosyltransferase-2